MVEAIESQFVPVCIFNNVKGKDAEVLKRFKEPDWNNPVVRFLNPDETDIIERKDRVWSTRDTVERMRAALIKAGKSVPDYLNLIAVPKSLKTETAEFAMHCYWEGEVLLGGIEGVIKTRSGWRDKLEVVEVTYAPEIVDFKKLVTTAKSLECASKVFAHTVEQKKSASELVGDKNVQKVDGEMRDAKASDQMYYLSKTPYRHLPLTDLQATKMNALAKKNGPMEKLLSPRQKTLAKTIEKLLRQNKDALSKFSFPDIQNELGNYQRKLEELLKKPASG